MRDLIVLNDFSGGIGCQHTGHVFEANDLHAHVRQLFGHTHKIIRRMYRTDGIADRAFDQLAGFERRLDGGFHVAHIVHGVEDAEHIDAIGRRARDKGLNDVVGIVPIANHILSAQKHLEARPGHRRAQFAQSLPGVFFEKPQTGVESRAAPGFQRPVANFVEPGGDRQHVFGAHARCDQALMRVAQHGLHDLDFPRHARMPP